MGGSPGLPLAREWPGQPSLPRGPPPRRRDGAVRTGRGSRGSRGASRSYSTVTDLARLRGLSTSRRSATANS